MAEPRSRIWLHRLGYITTAIVAVELIGVAGLAVAASVEQRRIAANVMAESRTHPGTLVANDKEGFVSGSSAYRADLPPIASMAGNGLRFYAMPSFGRRWYAVALWLPPNARVTTGKMIMIERGGDDERTDAPVQFTLARTVYAAMTARLDRISDGYAGDPGMCLDGTPVAFERLRGSTVTSGTGSASCTEHYKLVSMTVLRGLQASIPRLELPSDADWTATR